MVKVFLTDTSSYLGKSLAARLKEDHEVLEPIIEVEVKEMKVTDLASDEGDDQGNPEANEGDEGETEGEAAADEGDVDGDKAGEKKPVMKKISLWDSPNELRNVVLSSELIVLDLVDGGDKASTILNIVKEAGELENPLIIVGVSSIMTWNKTNAKSNAPIEEKDYKSRKCSSKYKGLKMLESLVLNSKKASVTTFVVAAGITYGQGEAQFQTLFKDAWMAVKDSLPCHGDGANTIPTIHVNDLCTVVEKVGTMAPEQRYIVAVDNGNNTQKQIVEAISTGLGTGKVDIIPADNEEALLAAGNTEVMLLNLKFNSESSYQTSLGLTLTFDGGFANVFDRVRQEFVAERDLRPLRIVMQGAPGGGKTHYAKKLCELYYLPHVQLSTVMKEVLEAGGELGEKVQAALTELDAGKGSKKKKAPPPKKGGKGGAKGKPVPPDESGRLPVALIAEMLKVKIRSKQCRNKGFVLDGFPEDLADANALFRKEMPIGEDGEEVKAEDGAEEGGDGVSKTPEYNPDTMVDFVINLEVTEEVAMERVKGMSETEVEEGHNDEEGFKRRWAKFEYVSDPTAEEITNPIDFFKTVDVLDVPLEVAQNEASALSAMSLYLEASGKPYNFHPTAEESAAAQAAAETAAAQARADEEAAQAASQAEFAQRKKAEAAQNVERQAMVLAEDEELVQACSVPLRKYLMSSVVPPLVDGLLEVCKVQPADPIDYLAEYLFKLSVGTGETSAQP